MNPLSDSWRGSSLALNDLQSRGSAPTRRREETGRFPRIPDVECAELIHEPNNVVSMLLNTQVMEWKLPSYSPLKRNLPEVQRNAQRGEAASRRELGTANADARTSQTSAADCTVPNQEPGPDSTRGHDNRTAKVYDSGF